MKRMRTIQSAKESSRGGGFTRCVLVFLRASNLVRKKYRTQHRDRTLPHSLIRLRAAFVSCQHSKRQRDELDALFTVRAKIIFRKEKKTTKKHLGFSLNLLSNGCPNRRLTRQHFFLNAVLRTAQAERGFYSVAS